MYRSLKKAPTVFYSLMALITSPVSWFKVWYLDDGSLADRAETVLTTWKKILDATASFGLEVKNTKCELIFPKTKS